MSIFHSPITTEQIQVLEVKFKDCPNRYLICSTEIFLYSHPPLRVHWYICSVQSENLCNFEIALCILRIPRLRNFMVVQSWDCTIHLSDLELQQHSVWSFTPMRMCRNYLKILRMRNTISRLRKFSDCEEHKYVLKLWTATVPCSLCFGYTYINETKGKILKEKQLTLGSMCTVEPQWLMSHHIMYMLKYKWCNMGPIRIANLC